MAYNMQNCVKITFYYYEYEHYYYNEYRESMVENADPAHGIQGLMTPWEFICSLSRFLMHFPQHVYVHVSTKYWGSGNCYIDLHPGPTLYFFFSTPNDRNHIVIPGAS